MGSSVQAAFPSCFGLNQESPNLLVWQNIKRTVKSAMHGSKWDLPPQLPHPFCSFINLDIGTYQFYKLSIVQEALHQGKRRTPQIGDSDISTECNSVLHVWLFEQHHPCAACWTPAGGDVFSPWSQSLREHLPCPAVGLVGPAELGLPHCFCEHSTNLVGLAKIA